jgi:ribonuclease VapC
MKNKPAFVLDSFALLAYLNGEPGNARVVEVLTQAQAGECRLLLCSINLGEILYTVERRRGLAKAQQIQALIENLPIDEISEERGLIMDAAHIKATNVLSYANAFVVAVAIREHASILTGDPEFISVEKQMEIEWLRN